ncbi:hypothetical protein VTK26DRAFT_3421 [Humicola hyalothermophila]
MVVAASEVVDVDDLENVDPLFFSKRSKASAGDGDFTKCFAKPSSTFILSKAASSPSLPVARDGFGTPCTKPTPSRPRTILQPKSPARLSPKAAAASPLTAPAGRSPTRGSKRMGGILSRRRTQRINALSFSSGASVPFSLDAALKGTIPSYSGSLRGSSSSSSSSTRSNSRLDASLVMPDARSSWTFEIHEDTPEQEMTNLLQHSTCTLDISSDEESEQRARRDRAEGRDKENIPPADDISQTSSRSARAADVDDMVVEKERAFLAEMNVADFYAEGCDKTSVIIIPGDEEDAEAVIEETGEASAAAATAAAVAGPLDEGAFQPLADDEASPDLANHRPSDLVEADAATIDKIMGRNTDACASTATAGVPPPQPIEGAGESFELWESGSAKDDGAEAETSTSSGPLAALEEMPQAAPLAC